MSPDSSMFFSWNRSANSARRNVEPIDTPPEPSYVVVDSLFSVAPGPSISACFVPTIEYPGNISPK